MFLQCNDTDTAGKEGHIAYIKYKSLEEDLI
uniref:Uncharacterized protein n=1 Tax=uncultured marine bacterium 577 TaxID=257398 RepID=Q6SFY7_9BACT|nr:hypothetical protein MBMO_EBAC080-L12H07.24 [uncultured marine bacterium 577]